jgi:hypothetical protein
MSISAAAPRPKRTRSPSFPHIALAVIGALALAAVLVALSVSNISSGSAATASSAGTGSAPNAVHFGYFRDPSTHHLLTLPSSIPNQSTPGPKHK